MPGNQRLLTYGRHLQQRYPGLHHYSPEVLEERFLGLRPAKERLLVRTLKAFRKNPEGPHAKEDLDKVMKSYSRLVAAAEKGEIQKAEKLLGYGVPTEISRDLDWTGYTPLMKASLNGHMEIVKLLMKNDAKVDFADHDGRTALFKAAGCGHFDVAQFLLEKGATVNFRNKYEETPLFYAASSGKTEIAELLLDHGADIHARDDRGWTAYVMALFNSHDETAQFLLTKGARTPEEEGNLDLELFLAAATGNNERILEMKRKGADVNALQCSGNESPLDVASYKAHADTVSLLLEMGANNPSQAFHKACIMPHWDDGKDRTGVGKLLLGRMIKAGPDKNGETALFHAVRSESTDLIQYALDKGVDPCAVSNFGNTAKDICHSDEIRILLEEHEKKRPVTKEALLEELDHVSGRYLYFFQGRPEILGGGWATTYRKCHSGDQANEVIREKIERITYGEFQSELYNYLDIHYFHNLSKKGAPLFSVMFRTFEEYSAFGFRFTTNETGGDSRGAITGDVYFLMPAQTAEKLYNSIIKDPHIIEEMSIRFFPEYFKCHRWKFSSKLDVVKDGEVFELPVPS